MKTICLILLLTAFILCVIAEEPIGTPETKEREEAITKAIESINTFKPSENTPRAKKEEEIFSGTGKVEITYKIKGNLGTGLIEFGKDEWIYIALHSWHLEDKIGDIILAIDNNGNLYVNEGHVCGGIGFRPKKNASSASSVKEFVENYVSWAKEEPWRPYGEKPAWIEFMRAESWGNVGAGMTYSESAKLRIYEDGNWTWSVQRNSLRTDYGSYKIDGEGILRPETMAELRQIIEDTNAFEAEEVAPIELGGMSREGPSETASSTIILNQNSKTHKIIWSGFGNSAFFPSFNAEKDKKDIRRLFFLLRRLPYESK